MEKFKLTEETKTLSNGVIVYRIEALKDFASIKKGDKGGWIEKESNLSQDGDCWVHEYAIVWGNAKISIHAQILGEAEIFDNAEVSGCACIWGSAKIFGNSKIFDRAQIWGHAEICGNAIVCGIAEVHGHAIVKNRNDIFFCVKDFCLNDSSRLIYRENITYTKSDDRWTWGCFYGTTEELLKQTYKDNEEEGKFAEEILKILKND